MRPELEVAIPADSSYSIISYNSAKLPKQYVAMIFSKWLRSLRFGNPLFKKIDSDAYYKQYHAYLENLMRKPDSLTKMAVLTDDHDIVLGFSVSREDFLDYIHVHKDHRRQGIGTKLLPEKVTAFGHITLLGGEIWQKKYKHWNFNPFA